MFRLSLILSELKAVESLFFFFLLHPPPGLTAQPTVRYFISISGIVISVPFPYFRYRKESTGS